MSRQAKMGVMFGEATMRNKEAVMSRVNKMVNVTVLKPLPMSRDRRLLGITHKFETIVMYSEKQHHVLDYVCLFFGQIFIGQC